MDNLFIQIKQTIKFFLQNKLLILPFIFILSFLFLCYLSPSLLYYTTKIMTKNSNNINHPHPRRLDNIYNLNNNITNETEYDDDFLFNDVNFTLIEGMNTNLTDILLYYEFIDSISHTYYGDWEYLYLKKNKFKYTNGNSDIDFYEDSKDNFLFNLKQKNCSNLSAYFSLKDGIYEDNYIEGNFTFNFNELKSEYAKKIIKTTKIIYLILSMVLKLCLILPSFEGNSFNVIFLIFLSFFFF